MGEIENMLKKYARFERISFSMPGHKQKGNGAWAAYDVTELSDTDSLHHSSGAVMRAEKRLAAAYSCDKSLIMVNGSTGGIFIMLAAVLKRGDKLLVSRICHMSVINACITLGIEPIFFEHELYEKYSIYGGADISDLKRKLRENSVSAVLVTSPNYFGIVSDIAAVRECAGDLPLLVDEAHGAHFIAGGALPESAVKYADITVQSVHKTLNGLNQAAFLHINGGRADLERVSVAAEFFQTSSPSYIIAASAENAVEEVLNDKSGWARTCKACVELKAYLKEHTRILIPERCDGFFGLDPTRLVFNFSAYGITGTRAEEMLREKYNIDSEMSDTQNLVMIATPENSDKDFEILKKALSDICKELPAVSDDVVSCAVPRLGKNVLSPTEAFYSEYEYILPADAAGRISAAVLAAYPPGVPICVPGSVITRECIEYIGLCDGEIIGMYNGKIKAVKEGTE